jgi:hypothetical protein
MHTKIWQRIVKVGVVALSMGVIAGVAQANINCGTPPCPTWYFSANSTTYGVASTLLSSEQQTNSSSFHPLPIGVTGAVATAYSNIGGTNSLLQQGYIGAYGHMGVTDSNSLTGGAPISADPVELSNPNHAIDNQVNVDSILFTFSASDKVNLTSFTTGWEQTDADYTVLAYTGSGTPNLANLTYQNTVGGTGLLQNGWTLIGNYNVNGAVSNGTTHNFSNTILSSYWLIGALNSFVGGVQDSSADYFKILSVTGCDCSTAPKGTPGCGGGGGGGIPEPGTLLLMSAGFIGLARINRRRQVVGA